MFNRNTDSKPAGSSATRVGLAAALAVAALAATPSVFAANEGMRVTKDPVTGQLRAPTAAEVKALEAKAAAKAGQPRGLLTGKVNPQQVFHRDGTVELELTDSSLMYSVATRNADGSVGVYCVPGKEGVQKVMHGQKTGAGIEQIGKERNHEEK